ncbi:hypothetical protein [Micromonospora sonneratiae]|uniref:Uncharacterized protein n=1 Tax=Micromonospora sonneratiae TaxID=1184706 RepID=A0ABW3YBI6_9ACTN
MSDLYQPADDRDTARRIAAAHTSVSRDVEDFLGRLPAVPTPADIAEYAALVAREELVRAERQAAAAAAGLEIQSVGTE